MEDNDKQLKPKQIVFVTAGTTCFDSLVRMVDSKDIKEELSARGYSHLVIHGAWDIYPNQDSFIYEFDNFNYEPYGDEGPLVVDYFTFSSSIADHLKSASLVISHAGIATFTIIDSQIPLCGANSIIGRAVVVHADPDDLGKGGHELSKSTGNAGGRIVCGIIGLQG